MAYPSRDLLPSNKVRQAINATGAHGTLNFFVRFVETLTAKHVAKQI